MDLINKDIEKSCQFLLTLKPSAQHKQFKEELGSVENYRELIKLAHN